LECIKKRKKLRWGKKRDRLRGDDGKTNRKTTAQMRREIGAMKRGKVVVTIIEDTIKRGSSCSAISVLVFIFVLKK